MESGKKDLQARLIKVDSSSSEEDIISAGYRRVFSEEDFKVFKERGETYVEFQSRKELIKKGVPQDNIEMKR